MKKAKKEKFPRFKVWVEIERLTKDGDEDSNYIAPMPDCVGTADTEKGAMAIQFNIAMQNGIDPENSDCRPLRRVHDRSRGDRLRGGQVA